jgi:oligopeptide/dipeptide ABC transporter ATP-binding protein
MSLLQICGLTKHYSAGGWFSPGGPVVHAVDEVSFTLEAGETLGIVGESGCGKSTLGRLIVRLERPTAGRVLFKGLDLTSLPEHGMRDHRKQIQIIFQDSYNSLNPRLTAGSSIGEPLANFGAGSRKAQRDRVLELLTMVGLSAEHLAKYPHELSGGQRQRVSIARALALQPELVVCDEPVSSLDVSIRAQIMNLLKDLREWFSLSYIFISHDLAAVAYLADRVAVMYMGKFVEVCPAEAVVDRACHPYTLALIAAVPVPDLRPDGGQKKGMVAGEPADPSNPPEGCRFHPRCSHAMPVCQHMEPLLVGIGGGQLVACHLFPAQDAMPAPSPETAREAASRGRLQGSMAPAGILKPDAPAIHTATDSHRYG